jgi:general stress protein YciG
MSDEDPSKAPAASSEAVVVDPAATIAGRAPKSRRGFAVMDPALVRELAKKGGVAAHQAGTAHEFNSEEARAAGRKGKRRLALPRLSSETKPPR